MSRLLPPVSSMRTPTSPPPAADPSGITSHPLLGWFKASDFDATTDGADVATWVDTGALSNDMAAVGSAGDQPVVARNEINTTMTAVQGSLTTQGMRNSAFTITNKNNWTVFFVIKFTSLPGSTFHNIFFGFDDELSNGMWMGIEPDGKLQITMPGVGSWRTNESVSISTWYRMTVRCTSSVIDVHLDGTLLTWALTSGAPGNTPTSFGIFNDNSVSDSRGQALLAEMVFVDGPVSDPERTSNLESYAQSRFGL